MKNLLIFTAIFFLALKAQSQNVGIGTVTPATILDVVSTTQGVLIPRVTTLQMNAIASPSSGLLVTNTDSLNRIFIYTGTAWKGLSFTDQNVDTALLVHRINNETIDGIKTFTKDLVIKSISTVEGINFGMGNNSRNVILGVHALELNTNSANDNIAIGWYTMNSLTTGSNNVAIGTTALYSTNGKYNNAIGVDALGLTTSGDNNEALGNEAGYHIADNTTDNAITSQSIYIGAHTKALANNQTNQIVIGYNATGLGSNTAIIGNNSTTITGISGKLFLATGLNTAPSSSSDTGTTGEIRVTAAFIYVCTATNTWVRSPLTTW